MVSRGTHFVKNQKSLPITNESQFKKKQKCLKLKMPGPFWRQMPKLFIINY